MKIYKIIVSGNGWNTLENRSNNAYYAELNGRFPATQIEEKLKQENIYVHKSFIIEVYYQRIKNREKEWHHVGHMYRNILYFDYEKFKTWFLSAEGQKEWKIWKENRQQYKKKTIPNCSIKWLEYPEFMHRPGEGKWKNLAPKERHAENVTVIDASPKSVDVVFEDGKITKKLKTTKGFLIKTPLSSNFEDPQKAVERY